MVTTITLTRHGQTNSNITGYYMGRSDEDLSDEGYNQVHRLSSKLMSVPIDSIYTSPLKRTYSTAAFLAKPHNLKPQVVDELTEIDFGDWQGLHKDEIEQRWPKLWQQWRTDPLEVTIPNGENLGDMTKRALRAFRSIVEADNGMQSIIVAHEAIIKAIAIHILAVSGNIYRKFEIYYTSRSIVHIYNSHSVIIKLNDTSHLEV